MKTILLGLSLLFCSAVGMAASAPTTYPPGSPSDSLQYNRSGSFRGISVATFSSINNTLYFSSAVYFNNVGSTTHTNVSTFTITDTYFHVKASSNDALLEMTNSGTESLNFDYNGVIGPIGFPTWWNKYGNGTPSDAGDTAIFSNVQMNLANSARTEVGEQSYTLTNTGESSYTTSWGLHLARAGKTFLDSASPGKVLAAHPITDTGLIFRFGRGMDIRADEPDRGGGYLWSQSFSGASNDNHDRGGWSIGAQPAGWGTYTARAWNPMVFEFGETTGTLKIGVDRDKSPGNSYSPTWRLAISTNGVALPTLPNAGGLATDANGILYISTPSAATMVSPSTGIIAGVLASDVQVSSVAAAAFRTAITAGSNVTVTATAAGVSIASTGGSGGASSQGLIPGGRLTTESGVPVSVSSRVAQGTLYYSTFTHNVIPLYLSSAWTDTTFTELSLSLSVTTQKNYDVFVGTTGGNAALFLSSAWTNDTTRADSLTSQDGVLVLGTDLTKRYVGTIRASASNATEDSPKRRLVYNHYNQRPRDVYAIEGTASWTYSSTAFRSLNADAENRIEVVNGSSNTVAVNLQTRASVSSEVSAIAYLIGIGINTTASDSTNIRGATSYVLGAYSRLQSGGSLSHNPRIGHTIYYIVERNEGASTLTIESNTEPHFKTGAEGTIWN